SPRRLFWFLIAAALVAAWKPHGRGIWMACVLIALWRNGNPLHWARRSWGALAFALVVILSSGSSGQGSWLLLNSVLPLVPLEGKAYAEERAALQPLLLEARSVHQNYAWEQVNFKYRLNSPKAEVVSEKWADTVRKGRHFNKVCRTLAFEALRADPLTFARYTLQKLGIALSEGGWIKRFQPKNFWPDQNDENSSRWKKRPKEVRLLYRMDAAEYDQMARERGQRQFAPARFIRRITEGWGYFRQNLSPSGNSLSLRLTGWLALAGLLCASLPRNVKRLSILWLPATFYAVTVFAVGDRLGRYAYPLNWLGVILIAIALDHMLQLLSRKNKEAASSEPS
ncbi:MAG TPA: hypothetical protein VF585_00190, partial [Chthoniobacterales bacterium]